VSGSTDSDSEMTDSSWNSESFPPAFDDDPFSSVLDHLAESVVLTYGEWRQHPSATGRRRVAGSIQSLRTSSESNRSGQGRRRAANNRSGGADDTGRDTNTLVSANPESQIECLFACPFVKKDPLRHRPCLSHILRDVRAVKQHLRRQHKDEKPFLCLKCKEKFESYSEHFQHSQNVDCASKPFESFDTIFEHQISEMNKRSDWFQLWDMVFQHLKIDSYPCLQSRDE